MTTNGRWSVTPHATLAGSLRPDPLIKLPLMRASEVRSPIHYTCIQRLERR
jgi:hypothetical protein